MSFSLPRRRGLPYDSSRAMVYHLNQMEDRIMSALEDAVAELRSAVENANSRFQGTSELEQALAAEREKYAALVASEDAEDVAQNEELAQARSATDEALAQLNDAAAAVSGLTDQVNSLGTTVSENAPAEAEGTGDVPTPGPGTEAPTEAPAEAPTADATTPDAAGDTAATADAPSPAESTDGSGAASPATPAVDADTTGGDASPVSGTPTPDAPAASEGAPTDADGNPVTPPSV